MAKTITNSKKKEFAKLLYLQGNLTQKEIAIKAEVSAKTMTDWVNNDGWKNLRQSLLVTKEEQIRWLYMMLDNIKRSCEGEDESGNPILLDSKTADTVIKITASIKNLETQDITTAEILSVGKKAISWAQMNMPEDVPTITDLFDGFIKETVNRN